MLAEEAFDVADLTKFIIDNVAILLLDIVWILFRQRDASKLAAAVGRLRRAREGFAAAHGRITLVHFSAQPEPLSSL